MAHDIEITEAGAARMAYVGETPWHKLGTAFPEGAILTPEEIAAAAGADYPVEKLPVYQLFGDTYREVPGRFNLTRMTDGKVLDIVGSGYKPTQNIDGIRFFQRFCQAGMMTMETCGVLDGGRRVFALAKIGQGFTLKGGDRMEGYLLLCLPHRMGEAVTAKLTLVRTICWNTWVMALAGAGAVWRMGHWHAFDDKMKDKAEQALGLAQARMEAQQRKIRKLVNAPAEREQVIEYLGKVSGSKLLAEAVKATEIDAAVKAGGNALDAAVDATIQDLELQAAKDRTHADLGAEIVRAWTEKDLNRQGRQMLDAYDNGPGHDLESAHDTWWGAFNAVTRVYDHTIGKDDDRRLTQAWYGDRAKLKDSAFALASTYAKAAN